MASCAPIFLLFSLLILLVYSHRSVLPPSSGGSQSPAPAPTQSPTHGKKNIIRQIIGRITGVIVGVVGGMPSGTIFGLFIYKLIMLLIHGRRKERSTLEIFCLQIKKPEDLAFLEREDGLAFLTISGRGGCGEVYRGVLPGEQGKEIAIKKVVQPHIAANELSARDRRLMEDNMQQIRSEIQTVGRIRHRNLV